MYVIEHHTYNIPINLLTDLTKLEVNFMSRS